MRDAPDGTVIPTAVQPGPEGFVTPESNHLRHALLGVVTPCTARWRALWPECHIYFDGVVCYDRSSGIVAHGGSCEPSPTTGCDAGGPMAIASAAPHRSDGGLMLGHPGCGKQ